ncbi:alpha/beta hydrolase [Desertivirga xinjiangensis]|uniref:alpha/beta hydrolase n=1 Tax=Desertivirga xinjiangensis TaxID=539206 RepID=UPI00210984E8|nr:alpha/beta fold hydrolase [Pedobacter xinjiangensis]
MYTHSKQVITAGKPLAEADKVVIMIHGRGARAENIISLVQHLNLSDAAVLAPQATNFSWYPYSFLAPEQENQPALDSALEQIGSIIKDLQMQEFSSEKIYLLGFSQGACLSLEYAARNAARYGGIIAFTGGLIGEALNLKSYQGDFLQTPVLVTTGDPDMHVPLTRVEESVAILSNMGAVVNQRVYKRREHTISQEEIELANQLIFV